MAKRAPIEVRSASETPNQNGPVLDMQAMIAQAVAQAVAGLAQGKAPVAVAASKASKPAKVAAKRAVSAVREFDESRVSADVERWDKTDGSHEFSVSIKYDGKPVLRFAGFKARILSSAAVQEACEACIEQNDSRE